MDTAYYDLTRNVQRRVVQPLFDKRKMPRIPLERAIVFTNGAGCTLRSFNYLFFCNRLPGIDFAGDIVTYYTDSNIEVVLQHTGKKTADQQEMLLRGR